MTLVKKLAHAWARKFSEKVGTGKSKYHCNTYDLPRYGFEAGFEAGVKAAAKRSAYYEFEYQGHTFKVGRKIAVAIRELLTEEVE